MADAPKLAAAPQVPGGGTPSAALVNAISAVLDRPDTPKPDPVAEQPPPAPVVEQPKPALVVEPPKPAPVAVQPTADEYHSPVPADVLKVKPPAPLEQASDDDDTPAPPEVARNERANHAWQARKAEIKDLKTQLKAKADDLAAKDAEIERLRTSQTPDLDEVMQLKNKIGEYESKLGQYDLSATEEFRQRFDGRMEGILQKGVSLLVRSGRDAGAAKSLMAKLVDSSLSMQQVQEAIADEPFALQGALVNLVADFGDISTERQEALSKWQETRAALNVQAKRENEIQLMENIERETQVAVDKVVQAGNWMFARSTDNAEWNQQVDERIKAVKGILRVGKPEELVQLVMEGITAKDSRDLFQAAHEKNQELTAKLQRLVQATPRMGGGGAAPAEPGAQPVKAQSPAQFLGDLFSGESRTVNFQP